MANLEETILAVCVNKSMNSVSFCSIWCVQSMSAHVVFLFGGCWCASMYGLFLGGCPVSAGARGVPGCVAACVGTLVFLRKGPPRHSRGGAATDGCAVSACQMLIFLTSGKANPPEREVSN